MSSSAVSWSPAAGGRSSRWPVAILALSAAGVVTAVVLSPSDGFSGLLAGSLHALFVALGGAIFTAIQGVSGARWHRSFRSVPTALASTAVLPALLVALAVAAGLKVIYPWARPGAVDLLATLHAKEAWLNAPFFLARMVVILLVWLVAISRLRERVREAEESPNPVTEGALVRSSVFFLLLLAPTISVAAWDWTMSIEPDWFSTIYSVATFAGSFLSGLAALAAVLAWYDSRGRLRVPLTDAQRHDLGKLIFGFSTFWAYLWYSQYLLIWYSNIPEETPHYVRRLEGGWETLFWLNPVIGWMVPFLVLLSVRMKKSSLGLFQASLVVLVGQWIDVLLRAAPHGHASGAYPVAMAATSIFALLAVTLRLRRNLAADGAVN